MTVAVVLLVSAAIVGWLAPRWLSGADLRRRDPLVLIVGWFVAMAGVVSAAVMGIVLLLLPEHGHVGAALADLDHCGNVLPHGSPPEVEVIGGLVATGVVIALLARLVVVATRACRRRARRRREHLSILRLAARTDSSPTTVLWLAHDRPLAFTLGRVIVATEGLTRHLPADSVAAVLTHEQAHLTGRHHPLLASSDALAAVLPFVPLFRRAPAAMRELVELAADVVSVRAHGIAAVRAALIVVSGSDVPGIALAMARDAIDVRIERLRDAVPAPGRIRRALTCATTGVLAAAAPLAIATTLLVAIGLSACLFTR